MFLAKLWDTNSSWPSCTNNRTAAASLSRSPEQKP